MIMSNLLFSTKYSAHVLEVMKSYDKIIFIWSKNIQIYYAVISTEMNEIFRGSRTPVILSDNVVRSISNNLHQTLLVRYIRLDTQIFRSVFNSVVYES